MTNFVQHTIDTAPAGSKSTIEAITKSLGFLPNLFATFAESPALIKAYAQVGELFDQTDLNSTERQVVLLTVSRFNNCEYCVAAHTSISQMQNLPADVVAAIRNDQPIADAKLQALRHFTQLIVDKRGWVSDEDLSAFIGAGYTRANVLEVILGVSFKTLSNFTNHVADTPLDEAFASNHWQSPDKQAEVLRNSG